MFKSSIVIGVIMLISFVSFYVKRIGVRIPEKLKESTFFYMPIMDYLQKWF